MEHKIFCLLDVVVVVLKKNTCTVYPGGPQFKTCQLADWVLKKM